jgi:putative ABC transport system ATP-binding protein
MIRLELRNVSRTYHLDQQRIPALHDVSLAAHAATVTVLVGRSGCGKSTLLNLAGAMDFPDSGEVLIDGHSTTGLNDARLTELRRNRIGFVFQSFQLLPTMTALENVELPLLLARKRNSEETARERLRWVGLEGREGSLPHQLSGGQMQRVAVARALVQQPDILIADEPTGNLDTASGDDVLELLQRATRELGATVLMATHSREAAAIADVRVFMRDGCIERIENAG